MRAMNCGVRIRRRQRVTVRSRHGRCARKASWRSPPNTAEPDPVPDVIEGETPIGDALGEGSSALPEVEGLSIDDEFGDELVGGSGEGGEEQEDSETRDPSRQSSESDPNSEAGSAGQGAENEVSNDLLSRLEDAFRNMLSSLNMDPPSGSDPADSSEQQSGQPSPAEGAQSGQKTAAEAPDSGQSGADAESASGAAPEAPPGTDPR